MLFKMLKAFSSRLNKALDEGSSPSSPERIAFYAELKRNQYEVSEGVVKCSVCGLQYGCGQCGSSAHLERLNETYASLRGKP